MSKKLTANEILAEIPSYPQGLLEFLKREKKSNALVRIDGVIMKAEALVDGKKIRCTVDTNRPNNHSNGGLTAICYPYNAVREMWLRAQKQGLHADQSLSKVA